MEEDFLTPSECVELKSDILIMLQCLEELQRLVIANDKLQTTVGKLAALLDRIPPWSKIYEHWEPIYKRLSYRDRKQREQILQKPIALLELEKAYIEKARKIIAAK